MNGWLLGYTADILPDTRVDLGKLNNKLHEWVYCVMIIK